MDLQKLKDQIVGTVLKYKYVLLILCVGLLLVLVPSGSSAKAKKAAITQNKQASHISEDALASILKRIKGAGRVNVLLSLEQSEQTDYQLDQDHSASSTDKQKTVTITDSQRNEAGLVRKVCAPTYRGAIIVCDGADDPFVQLSMIQAVSNITGLRSDQISVLKMQ